jgi:hypothetical protein
VGSAFLFVGFIGPSAAEVGPSAGPLLHVAVKERKVAKVITGLGATTVVAGWILWLRDLNDFGSLSAWLGSHFGFVLTIGAVLATIAAFLGAFGVGRNVERLVDVGDAVAASGGPPTPDQQARIEHLGAEIESTARSTSCCWSSRWPVWRRRATGRSRQAACCGLDGSSGLSHFHVGAETIFQFGRVRETSVPRVTCARSSGAAVRVSAPLPFSPARDVAYWPTACDR